MLWIILLFCWPVLIYGQDCQKHYTSLMTTAKSLIEQSQPNYKKALATYSAARISAKDCKLDKDKEIDGAIAAIFEQINGQRQIALKGEKETKELLKQTQVSMQEAKEATSIAEQALKEADEQRKKAENARNAAIQSLQVAKESRSKTLIALEEAKAVHAVSQKIVDAFYFYDDKLALASRDEFMGAEYGYINKEGEVVIDYQYGDATPFDPRLGLATVWAEYITPTYDPYFLDETGAMFLLAEGIDAVVEETQALILRGNEAKKFPEDIIELAPDLQMVLLEDVDLKELPKGLKSITNLKFLSLHNCNLSVVPEDVETFQELEVLLLSDNPINEVPKTIQSLPNIKRLDLSNTSIPEAKREALRQLPFVLF